MTKQLKIASLMTLITASCMLSVHSFAQTNANELMNINMMNGASRIVDRVTGRNSSGPYVLNYVPIVEKTERITINGQSMLRDIDYKIEYATGMVAFMRPITTNENVVISYDRAAGAKKNEGTISVPVEQLITQGRSGKLNLVGNFTSKGGANSIGYGALGVATELKGASGFNFSGTVLSSASGAENSGDTTAMKLASGFKVGFAEVSGELLQTGSEFKSSNLFGVGQGTDVRKLAMKLNPSSAVSAVLGLTQDQSNGADKETRNYGLAFNPNQTVAMGFNRTEAQDGSNTQTTDQTTLNLKGKTTSLAYTSTQGSNTNGTVTENTNTALGYTTKNTEASFGQTTVNDGKTIVETNTSKLQQKFAFGALNYNSTLTDKNGTMLENTASSLNMNVFNSNVTLGHNYVDDGKNEVDTRTGSLQYKLKNGQFDYATSLVNKNGVDLENSKGQLALSLPNTALQLINTIVDDGNIRTDTQTSIIGYNNKGSKLDVVQSFIDKNGVSLETRNVAYSLTGQNTIYGLAHSINDDGAIRTLTNQGSLAWTGKNQNAYVQQIFQSSSVLDAATTLTRYNLNGKFGSFGAEQTLVTRDALDNGNSITNNMKLTGVFDLGKHAVLTALRQSNNDDYMSRNDLDNNVVKSAFELATKKDERLAVKSAYTVDEVNDKSMITKSMQIQTDTSKSLGLKTTYTQKTGDLTTEEVSQEVGVVAKPTKDLQLEIGAGTKHVGSAEMLSQSALVSAQLSKTTNITGSIQTSGANSKYTTTQLLKASIAPISGIEFTGFQKMRKATGQDLPDTLNLSLKISSGKSLSFTGSYINYPEDATGKVLLTETSQATLSADLKCVVLSGTYGLNKNIQTLEMSRKTGLNFEFRLDKDSVLNGGYSLLEAGGKYNNDQATYKLAFKTPISKSADMQLSVLMSKYEGTFPENTNPEQQEINFKISSKL